MPIRTFLVEDNATIRAHLIPAMKDLADVEVIGFVETETDAVLWLNAHVGDLDLVVVDLLLREGSGIGVIRHFRRRYPRLPLVILTNYATRAIRERSGGVGATAVFDKSTELEDFLEFCRRLDPTADDEHYVDSTPP